MNYSTNRKGFGALSWLGLIVFAIVFLPMSPGAPGRQVAQADDSGAPSRKAPRVIKSVPAAGALDVDPKLNEISVTFDQDMGKGMSWTGEPPLFPPIDEGRKLRWIDARTCVLPVKLEAASYYRVGINSMSFQNFASRQGVAAEPTSIMFATRGASDEMKGHVQLPKIVSLDPPNGAKDVDPSIQWLRVTFDVPMGEGMSWTGGGANFPTVRDDKQPNWSEDGRTCALPVTLVPGHEYRLGLNSVSYQNFQSKWGVPLQPVEYRFRTRGGK